MLRALNSFTFFPDGEAGVGRMVSKGEEFEVKDAKYSALLVEKGHAEKIGKEVKDENIPDQESRRGDQRGRVG